jgi:hypothetical protein
LSCAGAATHGTTAIKFGESVETGPEAVVLVGGGGTEDGTDEATGEACPLPEHADVTIASVITPAAIRHRRTPTPGSLLSPALDVQHPSPVERRRPQAERQLWAFYSMSM